MGMADRIKERRLAMGYTQEELAEKLGLQKSAIAKYENGRVENIKRSVISNMASVLECSPSYLLDFSDFPNNETIEKDDYKTLKIVFDKFGYKLQPFTTEGNYTLQHKKQKEFIIIVSSSELNSMLYDISDYISVLISKRFEKMLNVVRSTNELNAAHTRTDIDIPKDTDVSDNSIMDDENF